MSGYELFSEFDWSILRGRWHRGEISEKTWHRLIAVQYGTEREKNWALLQLDEAKRLRTEAGWQ